MTDRARPIQLRRRYTIRFARAEPADCPVHGSIVMCSMSPECSGPMKIGLKGIRPRSIIKPIMGERERQVYLQPDGLDSNTYNTYNINIIKYLQYGRHTGTTNICLLPIVQSPWY